MEPGRLDQLSPFELKDQLIRYARDTTEAKAATHSFLDAGRGNPNWIATTPREAYHLLGLFGLDEARRVRDEPDLAGMPRAPGIADRLRQFLGVTTDSLGADLLLRALDHGVTELGFKDDAFVHELVDAMIGDNYPYPDRMLIHVEQVVRRFLEKVMFDGRPPPDRLGLFATEGGTAAMCYVFKSLAVNRLLRRGDTIALGTPIFTPYVELPHLADFALQTIEVTQDQMIDGRHAWQYSDAELARLEDPKVKAFFLVNPSNPASFAMAPDAHDRLVDLIRHKRPDLIILTDDVYGTFAPGFRSLAADLPRNTILVYSYSKHFGCTGWRLGVVGIHDDNILDEQLGRLPAADRDALLARYAPISTDPARIKFLDRMVADSRDVALNHTAGLSTPQQAQMALFSLFGLLDEGDAYTHRCRGLVHRRYERLLRGLGLELPDEPLRIGYYVDIDLAAWGRKAVGEEFLEYVRTHREPIDVVIGLARQFGIVLLNGSGFAGPPWSVRISLANLDDDAYETIGRSLRTVVENAIERWKQAQRSQP